MNTSKIVCKFKHVFIYFFCYAFSKPLFLRSSTWFSLLCSKCPTVDDVQVLHRWLVVHCHGNSLLEFAIWLQLEHSANLKVGGEQMWSREQRSLKCNEVRMRWEMTCWTCGSLAKEVLATAWLCSSSRWAVSSPSSISTRPAQKVAADATHVWCNKEAILYTWIQMWPRPTGTVRIFTKKKRTGKIDCFFF